ncbi:MAG: ribonuclease H-like domain-containing protein [Victivallaceae bacterium]|nr:ribonuclease H-like domain-containing protein [Victivallaceae bacterium]
MQLGKIVESRYENVVAIESDGHDNAMIYCREEDKVILTETPFRPFILLESADSMVGFELECRITELNGNADFAYVVSFATLPIYESAKKFLKQVTGANPSSSGSPYRVITDIYQQMMISLRLRSFHGMDFAAVRRLQFDIETLCDPNFSFPNPERPEDKIIIISMSDSTGWEKVISLNDMDEKELLETFVATVQERDPDVLEGHNIFRFDLPYIEKRAKQHRVKLLLGRDGSVIKKRNSRFSAAERTINYTRYDLFGRHIVDTFHLTQFYDITHRSLESYGLKNVARHFGVAAPNRTYIDGDDITRCWHEERDTLLAYALDDVRETRAIARILAPSTFYQAQLIPYKYQDCVIRGNATKIEAMLLSEYLAVKQSLPRPEGSRGFSGALTKAFQTGVFKNVWHCDIRSLYPSIILAEGWCPERDILKAYPRLLGKLRDFRFSAKDAEKSAATPASKDYFNALQTTFKILINSFYGYVGFSMATFNDYALADNITSRGREILTLMLDYLEASGATVIEMDTDGIYFQPPPGVKSTEIMEADIQNELPEGITVELDSTYPSMFCYKSKNYALMDENGEIAVTGAALKSRGLEPFQREIIHQLIALRLSEENDKIGPMFEKYREALLNHELPLNKIAKSETLNDSTDNYRRKMATGKGRRSAAYELAIASGLDYRQGDQVAFYVIGDKKRVSVVDNSKLLNSAGENRDENTAYYIGKLDELYKKFAPEIVEPKISENDLFS